VDTPDCSYSLMHLSGTVALQHTSIIYATRAPLSTTHYAGPPRYQRSIQQSSSVNTLDESVDKSTREVLLSNTRHGSFDIVSHFTQVCFPGMRRILTNHPNCRMLHMRNASHSLNVHYWSRGYRFETSTQTCTHVGSS
jgi:hypothetical protein